MSQVNVLISPSPSLPLPLPLSQDMKCVVNESRCGANITKFYNTKSGDVTDLLSAIYEHGPISVAIDASHKSFGFYSHGVYYEPKCGE